MALKPSCGKDPVFSFVYLVFPQFGLLYHFSPLRVFIGHSTPILILKTNDAAHAFTPISCWQMPPWEALPTGHCHSQDFCADFFLFLVTLSSEVSKLCTDLASERVPIVETSFTTESPEWVSVPKSLVSLFVFIFCFTSFQRDSFAFLGIWGPPPVFRSSFVEIAPHADDLLMYLWGRKWSPSPSENIS